MPWLLLVSGLYVASWVFEILVGILFAVAAHTTLTRLRNRMFLNLVQQVTTLPPCRTPSPMTHTILYEHTMQRTMPRATPRTTHRATPSTAPRTAPHAAPQPPCHA